MIVTFNGNSMLKSPQAVSHVSMELMFDISETVSISITDQLLMTELETVSGMSDTISTMTWLIPSEVLIEYLHSFY